MMFDREQLIPERQIKIVPVPICVCPAMATQTDWLQTAAAVATIAGTVLTGLAMIKK